MPQNKIELVKNHNAFKKILSEAEKLRWRKYQCYGNSYNKFGLTGIAIKINDKCERLVNVMKNKELDSLVKDESLRDTAIDLLNYAAMFVMTLDEVEHGNNNRRKKRK